MTKKKIIIGGSIIGGIALINLFSPSFSLFHFNSIVDTSTELTFPTENQIQDEKNWQDAQNSLSSFYKYLNLHQYEKARDYLSEGYAKNEENFSKESLESWTLKKQGDTKILNLTKEIALSKETTKVFSYITNYDLKDGGKNCGEDLTAYVVLRNNEWTIDTIHPNDYLDCE